MCPLSSNFFRHNIWNYWYFLEICKNNNNNNNNHTWARGGIGGTTPLLRPKFINPPWQGSIDPPLRAKSPKNSAPSAPICYKQLCLNFQISSKSRGQNFFAPSAHNSTLFKWLVFNNIVRQVKNKKKSLGQTFHRCFYWIFYRQQHLKICLWHPIQACFGEC